MTEPNIVYIGDEVLCDEWGTGKEGPYHVANGEGTPDDGSITTFENGWEPMSCYTTPDGRPVDGFGGAKIDVPDPRFTEGFAGRIQGWIVTEGHEDYESAVDHAVAAAVHAYGEWVREPTEADLKRRGLL